MVIVDLNSKRCLILILVFVAILVYLPSLKAPFIWDEEGLILDNSLIRNVKNLFDVFRHEFFLADIEETKASGEIKNLSYRPLVTATFMLDYYLWRFNSTGYHLTNLVFHIIVTILVFYSMLYLIKDLRAVFISAILFAVHPLHTEAVTYIPSRGDLLSGIFLMLSMGFFVLRRRSVWLRLSSAECPTLSKPEGLVRGESRGLILFLRNLFHRSCAFFVLSSISLFLAIISKETSVFFPAVIAVYFLVYNFSHKKQKLISIFFGYAAVIFLYFMLRTLVADVPFLAIRITPVNVLKTLMAAPKVIADYILLFIYPQNLHLERSAYTFYRFLDWKIIASCAALLVIIAAIFKFRSKKHLMFGAVWFILMLAPALNIIPIYPTMAEHYLYLPSIGLFIIIGGVLNQAFKKAKFIRYLTSFAVISFAIFYSCTTFLRNCQYQNLISFYKDNLKYSPESFNLHNQLAIAYARQGLYDEALKEHQKALGINPFSAVGYGNLALTYERIDNIDMAVQCYKKAEELAPSFVEPHISLGKIYYAREEYAEAIEQFTTAVKLAPLEAKTRLMLGISLGQDRRLEEAEDILEKLVKDYPEYEGAKKYLAVTREKLRNSK